eukprot:1919474-Alexandrium_andersonii.AAC.1
MSASLVGSEMCIRDRYAPHSTCARVPDRKGRDARALLFFHGEKGMWRTTDGQTVPSQDGSRRLMRP